MPAFDLNATAEQVAAAARVLRSVDDAGRQAALLAMADALEASSDEVLAANAADLASEEAAALSPAARDRLVLDAGRLSVKRVRVPHGVIGVIYENRPNVTSDVAGLCVRAGSAAFLRGSASALRSNLAIVAALRAGARAAGLPEDVVALVEDPDHAVAVAFMQLRGTIDCLIPRGGPGLLSSMREHATVPYVIDGDGNCHTYVDASANLSWALDIAVNAKAQRPGVCNAMETLLVHEAVAADFLPKLDAALPQVELRGDAATRAILTRAKAATEEDYEDEFLDLILAVKVVASVEEAIAHISRYSTGHSEAIVADDEAVAARFRAAVDAAAVVVNASTRFVDGGELGLGAEVGISTQKLHWRGPMGLEALTATSWFIDGKGQVRG